MVCDVEIATSPRRRVDDTKPTPASNIDMGDMSAADIGNETGGRGEGRRSLPDVVGREGDRRRSRVDGSGGDLSTTNGFGLAAERRDGWAAAAMNMNMSVLGAEEKGRGVDRSMEAAEM